MKTFLIPCSKIDTQKDLAISTYKFEHMSKEEIMNLAFKFHTEGNLPKAIELYEEFINKGFWRTHLLRHFIMNEPFSTVTSSQSTDF